MSGISEYMTQLEQAFGMPWWCLLLILLLVAVVIVLCFCLVREQQRSVRGTVPIPKGPAEAGAKDPLDFTEDAGEPPVGETSKEDVEDVPAAETEQLAEESAPEVEAAEPTDTPNEASEPAEESAVEEEAAPIEDSEQQEESPAEPEGSRSEEPVASDEAPAVVDDEAPVPGGKPATSEDEVSELAEESAVGKKPESTTDEEPPAQTEDAEAPEAAEPEGSLAEPAAAEAADTEMEPPRTDTHSDLDLLDDEIVKATAGSHVRIGQSPFGIDFGFLEEYEEDYERALSEFRQFRAQLDEE